MAIDFLIFGLLLISISINLLALGAFWVTPGLRTTANRFVINLLIVNIIGCLILGPTLFLTGNYRLSYTTIIDTQTSSSTSSLSSSSASSMTAQTATTAPTTSDLLKLQIKSSYSDTNSSNNAALTTTLKTTTYKTETLFKCNKSKCEEMITVENDETSETIVITEMEIDNINSNNNNDNNNNENNIKNSQQPSETYTVKTSKRCWSLDLAAALGALSVLLVVGDTWCAVTDPLRYHSRISGLKSWIMIAITWIISIFFGILSAIRDNAFNTIIFNSNNINNNNNNADYNTIKTLQPNELYNMIYSAFYFIVIILLPFGFVCGMYWRIFSEARENGLRMRQNGSSPLLQSALNLSSAAGCNQQQNNICKDTITTGGLTLKIDRRRSSDREAIKPLLVHVPVHNNNINNNNRIIQQKQISNDSKVPLQQQHQHDHDDHDRQTLKQDRNQNIVLTLSAANEEIRRNFSARQLSVLGSSFDDITDNKQANKNAIRQVQSTPNLKDYQSQTLNGIDHSHNALQLPTIQASPKALSYMTSIRHRLSNASSLFKYREESRAARISILVVIMFLISYLPYGLLVLLQGRLTNLFSNSTQIAICMVLMGNISSPFIFAYRNKRVRRGVKRLFGLDKRSRERQMNRNSISAGLLRAGTKASINVRRSASKASTYSVNSCKFLTPHAVNNGTFLMEIEKCHYLKSDCPNPKDAIIIHPEKRSILKIVCDSSRKLGCAANSCANSDNEQTDV